MHSAANSCRLPAMIILLPLKLRSRHVINPQLNADAFCKKIIHNGPIFMKLWQPVLGVRFL